MQGHSTSEWEVVRTLLRLQLFCMSLARSHFLRLATGAQVVFRAPDTKTRLLLFCCERFDKLLVHRTTEFVPAASG